MTIAGNERGLIAVFTSFSCIGLSFAILRLTPEVKLKRKKLEALRTYLKKAHQRSGAGVGEQVGEYLVYGLALGVGAKSIERLLESIPEHARVSYLPWYVYTQGSISPAEFARSMTSVVTATTSVVSSSAGAGGGASAGGGGGGGGGVVG